MDAYYPTAEPVAAGVVDPFDRARMDRGAEETFWRGAYAAPGESTAFDRARQASSTAADVEWTGPKRVAS